MKWPEKGFRQFVWMKTLTSPYYANSSSPIGSPPQQNRGFEIQKEKRAATFHEGKQFPPARKPLYNPNAATFGFLRSKSSSLEINNIPNPNYTTTIDLGKHSTSVKPSLESHYTSRRYSSCDANPPRYLFQWSTEINGFGRDLPKEPCSGKLKHAKNFWLGQRLNAYRAKIKSIFSKSACSNKPSAIAANNVGEVKKPKSNKDCQDKYVQDAGKTKPFEIFSDNNQKPRRSCVVTNSSTLENGVISRGRRSFSGVIQRHFVSKASSLSASSSRASSLSTSFSLGSVGYNDPVQLFKRSSISQNSELERSIEEAIAHCKQSQQQSGSKTTPHMMTKM